MEEPALPRASSTLAPPPLETAVVGTRALQRFDLGRARLKAAVAPAPDPEDDIEIIASTVKMSVPESVKNLPPAEESVPRTITIPIPRPLPLSRPLSLALPLSRPLSLALPLQAVPPRPLAALRDAVWAVAASASLLGIGSIATVVVYVLLFP
jgi:hypothetical protein